jgi:hypothetical protein
MPAHHARLPTPQERAVQLEAQHREHVRERRRTWLTRAVGAFGSVGVGLYLMGWGLHLRDPGWAGIAFWGGLLLGNLGVFATLLVTYLQPVADGEA